MKKAPKKKRPITTINNELTEEKNQLIEERDSNASAAAKLLQSFNELKSYFDHLENQGRNML